MHDDEARSLLRAQRAELERELKAAQELLRDAREAAVEGRGYGSSADAREEVLMYQGLVERLQRELEENERAEQRLLKGTLGQ